MSEGKAVVILLLIAFAWIGIVHAIDRLLGIYLKLRMERQMIKLMERHRQASEAYFKLAVEDEIDYMIEQLKAMKGSQ